MVFTMLLYMAGEARWSNTGQLSEKTALRMARGYTF
jgi:hypothetical protein